MYKVNFPLVKNFDTGSKIEFNCPISIFNGNHEKQLTFEPNYMYYLSGNNGTGKTTLMNIISFLTSFNGEYYISEKDLVIGKKVAKGKQGNSYSKDFIRKNYFTYIFQDPHIINIYTIEENLKIINPKLDFDKSMEIIEGSINSLSIGEKQKNFVLNKLIKIWSEKNNSPYYLSGGEKQLLSFIRSMIKSSNIAFADEPWAAMDFMLKEFIETQMFEYLSNEDIFYNFRNLDNFYRLNRAYNIVLVISHKYHHEYSSKQYGKEDKNWGYRIPVKSDMGINVMEIKRFKSF